MDEEVAARLVENVHHIQSIHFIMILILHELIMILPLGRKMKMMTKILM